MAESLGALIGEQPDYKVLFGGLTGNPIFLELKTTGYRNELEAIMRTGLKRIAGEGSENIRASLAVIVSQMQNAAQRRFPMALKIGLGPRQLDAGDDRTIELALASNAAFLSNSLSPAVLTRIQEALDEGKTLAEALEESEAFAVNRSSLYAGSFWTLIWLGRLSALLKKKGPRANRQVPVMRILDPRAEHCPTCPQKATVYSSWNEMLMLTGGLPADGSDDCHCITTGDSRVLTTRGEIPIRDVRAGDRVLTHNGRWRRVLNTIISLSGPDHKQARLRAPTGRIIGCTQDHLWLTQDGWRTTVAVAEGRLSVYNREYAKKVRKLRASHKEGSQVRHLCDMCEGLRVWKEKGSPSETLPILCDVHQGQGAVGRSSNVSQDIGGHSNCWTEEKAGIRSADRKVVQPLQSRRQGIRAILGNGWQKALYLSLSVGMDQRERANSRWNGNSPQKPRLLRRQNREPGDADGFGSQEASPKTAQSPGLRMRDMREDVREVAPKGTSQQILLAGVLLLGTPLYDLTVEEDHSFIIEGLISHNSNCRCRIKILDEGNFTYVI